MMKIDPNLLGRPLTKIEIDNLEMSEKEKQFAHMVLEIGGNVILHKETSDGYDFNFLFNPLN